MLPGVRPHGGHPRNKNGREQTPATKCHRAINTPTPILGLYHQASGLLSQRTRVPAEMSECPGRREWLWTILILPLALRPIKKNLKNLLEI